ncbi:cell wall-binding repeat-containing protein [Euzebya tangerina]|uniref:cell wall-binding repeat-containing protein n=1 Tax=Euzebya tangerina TaxID=591198 RepID=UPI000E320D51|nr:cell wall-binding repeat-containing protein [Euzebya tangerina]
MFRHNAIRPVISSVLSLALLASLLTLWLSVTASPASAELVRSIVDSTRDAGTFSSLVLDADGNPVISYHESVRGELKLARCNDPDCAGGDEAIQVVDTDGRVGSHTSLALAADGTPVIAYYDIDNADLKVVRCNDPNCAGANETPRTVDATGDVGQHASLALDAGGHPVISYYDATNDRLKVALCDDPACAGGASIQTVDGAASGGTFTSLHLDDAGHPVISHQGAAPQPLTAAVRLVHCDDPACAGEDAGVRVTTTDAPGHRSALELDDAGNPIIAYRDARFPGGVIPRLQVLHCNDPDCSDGDEIISVPNGAVGVGAFIDMTLDVLGHPVISHYDITNADLRVVHCNDPSCAGQDESNRSPDWAGDVGQHTSIALDAVGNPVIAEFVAGSNDLKLVHCDSPSCGEDEAIRTPVGTGTVGLHSSLQLNAADNPVASFIDGSNGDLEIVVCNEPICGGGDEMVSVLEDGSVVSQGTSLALGTSDNPSVAFRLGGDLALAHCTDQDCAQPTDVSVNLLADSPPPGGTGPFQGASVVLNGDENPVVSFANFQGRVNTVFCNDAACAGRDELFSNLDDGLGNARPTALTLDDAGNPVVAYDRLNAGTSDFDLLLAHCNDPLCQGDDESIEEIGDPNASLGSPRAIVLDADGNPVVAFESFISSTAVGVLHCNDPNCAGGDESLTFPDTSGVTFDADLAIAPDGNPVLAYTARPSSTTPPSLRLLHCNDPNCAGDDESPTTIDDQGAVGIQPSLALNSAGHPVVSYHDESNGDLKVLHCNDAGCRPNQLPTADAGGPYSTIAGDAVTLAGSGGDPDGGAVTYQWDLDGDGDFDDATGAAPEVDTTGFEPGDRTIALRVVDDEVNHTTASTTLTVQPDPDGPGDPNPGDPDDQPDPDNVIETAIALSQERFPDNPQVPPTHVVLARTLVFADALTGSVLTSQAPLLFTDQAALDPRTEAEINRLLGGQGTVILLGGINALAPAVEQALIAAGYDIVRLEGPSRVETAVAIADHARTLFGDTPEVGIARADSPPDNPTAAWADSVSAGGWAANIHAPILLTPTASLHPATGQWLADHPDPSRVILGGTAAVSDAAAQAIGPHQRVGGSNRFETAVLIATQLRTDSQGTTFQITNGEHVDGWAYALAGASLSAIDDAPLLLAADGRLPIETDQALCAGPDRATVRIIGDTSVVGQAVRDALATDCPTTP